LIKLGYSNITLIGQGGFGKVFKAHKNTKDFAIKVPLRFDCDREINAMAKLHTKGFLNK